MSGISAVHAVHARTSMTPAALTALQRSKLVEGSPAEEKLESVAQRAKEDGAAAAAKATPARSSSSKQVDVHA